MICKNCGNVIPDESIFCTECGTMVASQPEVQVPDFNYPPVQVENYDYADGAIPEEEIIYDPETNAENAKAFIAEAKSKLPLAIVAVSLAAAGGILFSPALFLFPIGTISYPFLCFTTWLAGLICLCISKNSVKKLPVVIPEMLDLELLEEYNSAERKLKPVRILHKAGTIYYLVSGIILGASLVLLLVVLGLFVILPFLGIALPMGLSAIMSVLSMPFLLLSELQF